VTHELLSEPRFVSKENTNTYQECASCHKTFTAEEVKEILAKYCTDSHWLKGTK